MYYRICLIVSMCTILNGSHLKEDIVLHDISHANHANHWGAENDALRHHATTSIVTQRVDRGTVDLPGVQRVLSEDSADGVVVNVATTVDVNAKCCNSKCCDDDADCGCVIQ